MGVPAPMTVRVRRVIVVGGPAHAAGVDDQGTGGQTHAALQVRVTAQQHPPLGVRSRPGQDLLHRGGARTTWLHGVQEVGEVVRGRAVESQDVAVQVERRGQCRQPRPVLRQQHPVRQPVGADHPLHRGVQDLALVVAAHGGQIRLHQPIGRLPRAATTGERVAEVDGHVDALGSGVGQHGLPREQVAVDVRGHRDAHPGSYPDVEAGPLFSPRRGARWPTLVDVVPRPRTRRGGALEDQCATATVSARAVVRDRGSLVTSGLPGQPHRRALQSPQRRVPVADRVRHGGAGTKEHDADVVVPFARPPWVRARRPGC